MSHSKHLLRKLEEHFNERIERFGGGLQAVDWKSAQAQYVRFEQLLKVVDVDVPFSLNDYGCGYGELVNFLNSGELRFQYFGFDVSTKMIEEAKEFFRDCNNCKFSSDKTDLSIADYTVASGIFNLKFDVPDKQWEEFVLEKVRELNNLSRKGFSFNALTTYSDKEYRRDDLYYADPLFWFDYCKRNFSSRVALLHDYPEYDWTLIVRK